MFIIHGWTPLFFPVVHSVGHSVYQIKGVSNKMIFHFLFCFVSFVCVFDSFHLIAAGVCVCCLLCFLKRLGDDILFSWSRICYDFFTDLYAAWHDEGLDSEKEDQQRNVHTVWQPTGVRST